nr:putative reverse transcriptase domain-containing protein [Tanacetum cinerariifolium]
IIMVNVILPDHMDDAPVVEPNQHNDVPAIPEPVLVDEDEDPKEKEFKEEEEPQEEEDDMEVDIEEDENEPKLTHPYEGVDPLNPPPPASESEPEDVIEVEDTVEDIDSLFGRMTSLSRRLCGREMAHAVVKKKEKAKDEYYGKLILDLGAVELSRWFEKTESVFRINECIEGKKVKFATAILQGHALTWWNSNIATMGLETMNQMPWTEMK